MNTVVSQALAVGLPVIATRHSGLPEQVEDGENGFLVEEADYQALAGRIVALSSHPELLPEMSLRGREIVLERYDAERLIELQVDAYVELCAAHSRR